MFINERRLELRFPFFYKPPCVSGDPFLSAFVAEPKISDPVSMYAWEARWPNG